MSETQAAENNEDNLEHSLEGDAGEGEGQGNEEANQANGAGEHEGDQEGQDAGSTAEEFSVDLEDDEPELEWVRDLRRAHGESQNRNRKLEEELRALKQPGPAIGKKPGLEDFDYDTDKYEQALTTWYDQKREAEAAEVRIQQQNAQAEQAWGQKLQVYETKKQELGAKDFDTSQDVVTTMMSEMQQGIIVNYAQNPALMVYALGKNPSKAKELADIQDPILFALKLNDLEEKKLKMRTKKTPPAPEQKVVAGTGSGSSDSVLDKPREEAARTGDISKVVAYKRKKRGRK